MRNSLIIWETISSGYVIDIDLLFLPQRPLDEGPYQPQHRRIIADQKLGWAFHIPVTRATLAPVSALLIAASISAPGLTTAPGRSSAAYRQGALHQEYIELAATQQLLDLDLRSLLLSGQGLVAGGGIAPLPRYPALSARSCWPPVRSSQIVRRSTMVISWMGHLPDGMRQSGSIIWPARLAASGQSSFISLSSKSKSITSSSLSEHSSMALTRSSLE